MKSKLKIIIPIAVSIIAIALAAVFISFKPQNVTDITALMQTANGYFMDDKFEEAIAEFEKIISLDPNNADAYIGIAQVYEAMGDIDSAVYWLEKGQERTGDGRIAEYISRLKDEDVASDSETTTAVPKTTTAPIVTTAVAPTMEYITIKEEKYLTSLKFIDLCDKNLTGEEIKDLKYMTNLTDLWLGINNISDINTLSSLTNLTRLSLFSNKINNVNALSGLTNLTYLDLESNNISDISALSSLTNLEDLDLQHNNISDISALSGLTNLMCLNLSGNNFTDVNALSGLTNLTELYLFNNDISTSDIEWLKEQLPNCNISY